MVLKFSEFEIYQSGPS